jgi:hypothetical protein
MIQVSQVEKMVGNMWNGAGCEPMEVSRPFHPQPEPSLNVTYHIPCLTHFFCPENGGSRCLQIVATIYQTTWHHIPDDGNLHFWMQFKSSLPTHFFLIIWLPITFM